MESNSIVLKNLCLLGLAEQYPIGSTRFQAFAQTEGLFETITGDDRPPDPLGRLGIDATDMERAVPDAVEAAYGRALGHI